MNMTPDSNREHRDNADSGGFDLPPPLKRQKTGKAVREHGFMRDVDGGSAHFLGSASGIHFIRSVSDVLAKSSATRFQSLSIGEDLVPGEDDRLQTRLENARSETLWTAGEVLLDGAEGGYPTEPITFEDLVRWSQNYFENWHPLLPYLHAPSVLRVFERIAADGIASVDPVDAIIVRSLISISTADQRQKQTSLAVPLVPASLIFMSIEQALSSLQIALCKPTAMHTVQAAVSTQLFLVSMLRYNAASRIGGLIVRMAFQLGLHRCPSRFSRFSPTETEVRRRVFWCIYTLERQLCQSLGLPLDIRDDDIDVCFPGEEMHGQDTGDENEPLNQEGRFQVS
jgi:hypothetical protein